MGIRRLVGVIGVVLAVSSSDSAMAGDKVKFGKISSEEWQIVAPADYPEADAVVIFDRAELRLKDDHIVFDCHCRIKILTQAGVERVGNQSFYWDKEFDRIKNFEGHTITPDGRKHKVEDNAIFTKQAGDFQENTFTFPALEPGCIIEYSYRIINERFWYLSPWYFQTNIYTFRSTFSVTCPNGYEYNVACQNIPFDRRDPKVEERLDLDGNLSLGETLKTFTWELTNLPPITDEPYMSSEYDYRSSLKFQIVSYEYRGYKWKYDETWPKKAESLEKHFSEYRNAGDEIRRLTGQVTEGLTSDSAKSRAIFEFVRAEYRTVNDHTSRYFGHERMKEFLETKSGTGEEKNYLLVLMNQEAGLQSWPIMISTRDHAKFDPTYPDLRQFNYFIVFVQFANGYEFLDCSNRFIPYGLLPPNCLVNAGLLVDGKDTEPVKIRGKSVYSGRSDVTDMYVDSDGAVSCTTQCSFRGYYASGFGERYDLAAPEDFVKENFMDQVMSAYTLESYDCRLDSTDTFVMTAGFTVEDAVDRLDENLVVRPVGFDFRRNPFESAKRFFPVDFSYPFTYKNEVEIHVADSVSEYILPADTVLTIPGASFKRQCRRTDSSAVVLTIMTVDKAEFLPVVYQQLRGFFDQVASSCEDDLTARLAASGN